MAHDWCAGFLAGVELAFDDWQPLLGDQSNSAFLVPFVKLGTDEGRDEINEAQDPRAEYDKFMDLLASCVVALRWILEAVLDEKSAATAQKPLTVLGR